MNSFKETKTSEVALRETDSAKVSTPEGVVGNVKKDLAKYDLEPIKEVEVTDPFTGKKSLVTIDRTGHNEHKLIVALADPNLPRDRKDHEISMYLYERGAQSASMFVDLFRYKGQHTKETRVFKSQIRFDFQMFAESFVRYLDNQSRLLGVTLGVDIYKEREAFAKWLNEPDVRDKGCSYLDFARQTNTVTLDLNRVALVEVAMNALDEAATLMNNVKRMADAREREKGKGVYISKDGVPYSDDDPELDNIIKADREAAKQDDEQS